MDRPIVQDLIADCLRLEAAAFCLEHAVPVLIAGPQRRQLSFGRGDTRLITERRNVPRARELIRRGNDLTVYHMRPRSGGVPGRVRVGRSTDNDIVLADDTISNRHAVFQCQGAVRAELQDLASMNGTVVNGVRLVVGQPMTLFDGDSLVFGDLAFLFFYPAGIYEVLRSGIED